MDRNEQWKFEGDCKRCRRKAYCSKECAASRRRVENLIREKLCEELPKYLPTSTYELIRPHI